ncbi:MAG: M14 family zinc carboxypeptidase [Planctomycetota bacterium]|nr:M14 family zinc carboxypeptidase [Planctomycetota bacterium]
MIPNAFRAAAAVWFMAPLTAAPQLTPQSPRVLGTDGSPTLEAYLPAGQRYAPDFPRPGAVLGWPVGTWHVRHDQLVRWYETVAAASPRAELFEYGRTHEERPLLLCAFSSPRNIERLDEIRTAHAEAVRAGAEDHDGPSIVWMGYGVHGNESSASNASLLLAYHLAAATGPEFEAYLDRTVILVDPCVNPDGGARFAHWANMHKGRHLTAAPAHRDHREAWPGGRTNHYWFDLNRDWLLLTHPESRGRIDMFQTWLPTVLTDYHEMGSGSTYFFQPGIPSRRNPLTPARNHELTAAIATYHAKALDGIGSQYFTQERFDDFYYGKGSTYPDVQGSIGILFEQASSRGHLVDSKLGEMSFPFTIRNQFTTSLSTLRAADELRAELGAYQREFHRNAVAEALEGGIAGWLFGGPGQETSRVEALADILARHGIEVRLARRTDDSETARMRYFVPADQPQYRLVRALFEDRTSLDDNTFYDVSAWSLAHSFDVPVEVIQRASVDSLRVRDPRPRSAPRSDGGGAPVALPADTTAFVCAWDSILSPPLVADLLAKGVRLRVTTAPISTQARVSEGMRINGPTVFAPGSILVPLTGQELSRETVSRLTAPLRGGGVPHAFLASGLIADAPDLGSASHPELQSPQVLIAVGSGVSAYEAGEVWHDMDTRMGLAATLVERDRLADMDLASFTHVVLVNGATAGWGETEEKALLTWTRKGGVLIATKRASVWAAEHRRTTPSAPHEHGPEAPAGSETEEPARRTYGDYESDRAATRIAGTIFRAAVDTSHPIAYGLGATIAVFRNFEQTLPEAADPYATPVRYTEDPLVAGFASRENVDRLAGSPAIRVERVGAGTVVAMIDNPVFRGVWYGTRRFLVNAIFFGHTVQRTGPIEERSEAEAMDYDHGHAHGR